MRFYQPSFAGMYSRARPFGRLAKLKPGFGFTPWALCITMVVSLLGCGAKSEDQGATGPDAIALVPPQWPDGGAPYCAAAKQPLSFLPKPANVLVLFDRSGSMSRGFGTTTRFEAAKTLLGEVAWAYQDRIRFGFQQFPKSGGCGEGTASSSCCAQPPSVPMGPFAAAMLGEAMVAAGPVEGNTPTSEALRFAAAYFATVNDGISERYVLLSTDGEPSCLADGSLGKDLVRSGQRLEGPCVDALKEVAALRMAGVKVIVLGIGNDLVLSEQGAPSCLEDMARAGGVAREGTGGPGFFSATNPKELERALQRIFGAVIQPSCVVAMSEPAPHAPSVSVFFDDQQVPFDQSGKDGWLWVEGKEGQVLQLVGKFCQKLERLQVQQVEIRQGCAPCKAPTCA